MTPFMSFVFGNESVRMVADDKFASQALGDQ
jgi:hypothetical protein